jgi:uncharacterized membrane protein YphA (DoxX/SURF4 family)
MDRTLSVNAPWPLAQKLAFRFFFLFFTLYVLSNPNGAIPLLNVTYRFYIKPIFQLLTWCSEHLFHFSPYTNAANGGGGSGDTTYHYLLLLFCTVVSFIGALIWSAVNRQACNYDKLYYWLLVVVRFYLGFTMIGYGAVKVVKLQFPYPGPGRLLQAYGDSSPMALAWTFMGYSRGYNYFTGLAEVSCGILLLFRKTTTLGALIALVVSANIMAINYCFDVPVKILSTVMVVMSLFILCKDFHRFVSFFFLNEPTAPANITAKRFKTKWKNITLITVKCLLIFYMAASIIDNCIQGSKRYSDNAPKAYLYGAYKVKSYKRKRDNVLLTPSDDVRWRRLIIKQGYADVVFMNDSTINYVFNNDTVAKRFTMYAYPDTSRKYIFNYSVSKPDVLTIKGVLFQDSINMTMQKYNEKSFLLMNRGFHWINESPNNR